LHLQLELSYSVAHLELHVHAVLCLPRYLHAVCMGVGCGLQLRCPGCCCAADACAPRINATMNCF
jgi:hypothetical protein